MPITKVIADLQALGANYPESTFFSRHTNKAAAESLMTIDTVISFNLSERVQEIQLLDEIGRILEGIEKSSSLVNNIKNILLQHETYQRLKIGNKRLKLEDKITPQQLGEAIKLTLALHSERMTAECAASTTPASKVS
jgi:hypothetical protein